MLEKLKALFQKKALCQVLIPIVAGVLIYYTPTKYEWVDKIIVTVMEAFGMEPYPIDESKDEEEEEIVK